MPDVPKRPLRLRRPGADKQTITAGDVATVKAGDIPGTKPAPKPAAPAKPAVKLGADHLQALYDKALAAFEEAADRRLEKLDGVTASADDNVRLTVTVDVTMSAEEMAAGGG